MLFVKAIIACAISWQLGAFLQALLHRLVGHRPVFGLRFINRTHVQSHHKKYSPKRFELDHYDTTEASVTYTYVAPVIVVYLLASAVFSIYVLVGSMVGLGASFYAQVYVHEHFHLTDSWLQRYGWFVRLKALHRIHHERPGKNFGLVNFHYDRLAGSFVGLPRPIDSQAG